MLRIKGLRPSFPQISLMLEKYPKTCQTWHLYGYYTWVKLYVMWNDKLKTLDYFLYLPKLDLDYKGSIWAQFSQSALMPQMP